MRAGRSLAWLAAMALATGSMPVVAAPSATQPYARIAGGTFRSALDYSDRPGDTRVGPFELMRVPVTNGEFLAFVRGHPEFRRDRVAGVFAEPRYLSHWAAADEPGTQAPAQQPVVQVSWFAARAFCAAQGARLPTWDEWEFVAASDETRVDARLDPAWRERILAWYSRPSSQPLPAVGGGPPNVHGVRDIHGLVWEWTEDFTSLLLADDTRNAGDGNLAKFCGAGSLTMNDRNHYAVLMRVAMLSSLEARHTTANLGFRCARDLP
jgi:formylglycine-generating enzyme required for sulfatase activity